MAGYIQALSGEFNDAEEEAGRPDIIDRSLRVAKQRKWKHLATDRLENITPEIPLGKRFWGLTSEEKASLNDLFDQDAIKTLISSVCNAQDADRIEIIDAAYWLKGCSSLGRLRYAVLVKLTHSKNQSELFLIDVKEGTKAAAPHDGRATMPADNAERVVAGARALSPHLGLRMAAGQMLKKPVMMRELMPQDLKIEFEGMNQKDALLVAAYLGAVVGKAHGRQLPHDQRQSWIKEAERDSGDLEAPTWLWSSVVRLLALHEEAYLEHCRRFALDQKFSEVIHAHARAALTIMF